MGPEALKSGEQENVWMWICGFVCVWRGVLRVCSIKPVLVQSGEHVYEIVAHCRSSTRQIKAGEYWDTGDIVIQVFCCPVSLTESVVTSDWMCWLYKSDCTFTKCKHLSIGSKKTLRFSLHILANAFYLYSTAIRHWFAHQLSLIGHYWISTSNICIKLHKITYKHTLYCIALTDITGICLWSKISLEPRCKQAWLYRWFSTARQTTHRTCSSTNAFQFSPAEWMS